MTLNELKEKFPEIKRFITMYDGEEYLKINEAVKNANDKLRNALSNYQGYVLVDTTLLNELLSEDDKIILS